MVINKRISTYFNDNQQNQISKFIEVNKDTFEYSFNLDELNKKKWVYAAIDDNNFNSEKNEIAKIVNLTKDKVQQFACLNLELLKTDALSENSFFYLFDNTEKDWNEILSPFNEYTLWDSAIFDINFNIFIIKPWSVGYNLLIAGKEEVIKDICSAEEWLINNKYPIFPI